VASIREGKRWEYLIFALLLILAVVGSIILNYDPEAEAIEFVAREYVGNLQGETFLAAGQYVYPQNLIELKQSAIQKAGMNEGFRQEILRALGVASLEDLRSVSKERFFEFLVKRSFAQHNRTFEIIRKAKVIGVKVRRKKDKAWAQVSFRLVEDSVEKRFRMRLKLKNENGWFVMLYE